MVTCLYTTSGRGYSWVFVGDAFIISQLISHCEQCWSVAIAIWWSHARLGSCVEVVCWSIDVVGTVGTTSCDYFGGCEGAQSRAFRGD